MKIFFAIMFLTAFNLASADKIHLELFRKLEPPLAKVKNYKSVTIEELKIDLKSYSSKKVMFDAKALVKLKKPKKSIQEKFKNKAYIYQTGNMKVIIKKSKEIQEAIKYIDNKYLDLLDRN